MPGRPPGSAASACPRRARTPPPRAASRAIPGSGRCRRRGRTARTGSSGPVRRRGDLPARRRLLGRRPGTACRGISRSHGPSRRLRRVPPQSVLGPGAGCRRPSARLARGPPHRPAHLVAPADPCDLPGMRLLLGEPVRQRPQRRSTCGSSSVGGARTLLVGSGAVRSERRQVVGAGRRPGYGAKRLCGSGFPLFSLCGFL